MKKTPGATTLPQVRQVRLAGNSTARPMVSPVLLRKVINQGNILDETRVEVMGLSAFDIKRLEEAGIFTLKQLAALNDADVLAVPHFGVVKVRRLKTNLKSFLSAALNDKTQDSDQPSALPETVAPATQEPAAKPVDSSYSPAPVAGLEAFYESLDRIEKRLGTLESRFARARKK